MLVNVNEQRATSNSRMLGWWVRHTMPEVNMQIGRLHRLACMSNCCMHSGCLERPPGAVRLPGKARARSVLMTAWITAASALSLSGAGKETQTQHVRAKSAVNQAYSQTNAALANQLEALTLTLLALCLASDAVIQLFCERLAKTISTLRTLAPNCATDSSSLTVHRYGRSLSEMLFLDFTVQSGHASPVQSISRHNMLLCLSLCQEQDPGDRPGSK